MTLIKSLLYFALSGLLTSNSGADPNSLSDAGFLRKASLHIRGIEPSLTEYSTLRSFQNSQARQEFLQNTLRNYLISSESQDRMVFRLSERFQLLTPNADETLFPKNARDVIQESFMSLLVRKDATKDLFARLVRDNLPWDYLLTGKEYNAYPLPEEINNVTEINDIDFFSILSPDLEENPPAEGQSRLIRFPENDLRIAGVLSTPRFLSRYTTTNVNKNRRRAAAVFRIFLCDPMFPIIPPPSDRKGTYLDKVFNDQDHKGVTESLLERVISLNDAQRHGSDQRCISCHYKLDPMGRTFQNIGLAVSPQPSPGALAYARPQSNQKVNIKLRGLGDLGKEITKQPEYVSCQIDWFWQEFIGSDIPLRPDRKQELISQFESVGRKTNDFIRLLISSPEFRTKPRPQDRISFFQVQPLLQRCDNCHSSEPNIPSFAEGKFSHRDMLEIKFRLNAPDGHRRKMPRDWTKWNPQDLQLLKTWINQGAVDSSGQPILSADDFREK